jgi:TRAP-type C4-dicarboxylate transport system permease small subunit
MKSYKRFVDSLNAATLWIAIITTSVMLVMIVLQVLFRYVIRNSLSFSEELARYMFVWATFMGSAIALSKRAHVSIEIMVANLPYKIKKGAIVVTNCISMIFFILMIVYGIQMILRTGGQTSPALGLRMSYVYAAVPLAGIVMLANGICNGYEEYKNPDIIKSEGVE